MEEYEIMENDTPQNEQVKENTETPTPKEGENDNILKTALAQKEHFKEKAQKLEAQLKEVQGKIPQGTQVGQDPRDVVKLAKALEGFSEEETEFIYRNAKGGDISNIIEASKDDWVKTAIEAKREKLQKDNKIPSPSNPMGSGFQEKGFLEIKDMTDEQFNAYQKELIERANTKRSGGMGL